MVRVYKRKTNRVYVSEEIIKKAVTDILKKKISYRKAFQKYGVSTTTLYRRVAIAKRMGSKPSDSVAIDSGNDEKDDEIIVNNETGKSKFKSRQVFTDEEEKMLNQYFVKSSKIFFGSTLMQARQLAFDYAAFLQLKNIPDTWITNKSAGKDWVSSFMVRHSNLSLRKPENTNIARASAFNPHNVNLFFENYLKVMQKYKLQPERIVNLDESGITTVLDSPKVIYYT